MSTVEVVIAVTLTLLAGLSLGLLVWEIHKLGDR